jgi:hypothetical protein
MSLVDDVLLKNEKDSIIVVKSKLQEDARSNCKHCYGRGYIGFSHLTDQLVICSCVLRNQSKKSKESKNA